MGESRIPVTLTIAGSDSGGGAGIQADLKTFHSFGCFGTSAITAITAQNTTGVRAVQGVDPEIVGAQLEAILEDFPVAAAKTGMLYSAAIIRRVRQVWEAKGATIPLVVDPVMVSTSGHRLLEEDAIREMVEFLSIATIITPNLPEASVILGRDVERVDEMEKAARDLAKMTGVAVLLKGGHLPGETSGEIQDVFFDGEEIRLFRTPKQETRNTHGTGCTLSSAIVSGLAHGLPLPESISRAQDFLQNAIRRAPGFGKGHGPLNHFR